MFKSLFPSYFLRCLEAADLIPLSPSLLAEPRLIPALAFGCIMAEDARAPSLTSDAETLGGAPRCRRMLTRRSLSALDSGRGEVELAA